MANKQLFRSTPGPLIPATNAFNSEGAPAYAFEPRHALAQYASTGCLNATFYASAGDQLETLLRLCRLVDAEFIARTAVYCRERGFMKDVPALLCAVLATRDRELLSRVFPRVVTTGRMLRTFVQILRSGVTGRKSLGTCPKRLVREWLEAHGDRTVLRASVGVSPSLADILKMVHPKPTNATRRALYGYLLGRSYDTQDLPEVVRHFEDYKSGATRELPDVPFEMLTSLGLGSKEWAEVARRASWQTTRMNLNTFARHGVFEQPGMGELVAERLRDPEEIAQAHVLPYQLLVAYANVSADVPGVVREALQDAIEVATANVPAIDGEVYVLPDVSSSMDSPVTGHRRGSTTTVSCAAVAGLVAASILRRNPRADVVPFREHAIEVDLNPRDSVMTNARRIAELCEGGTNCSAPLQLLNERKAKGDLVVFVSDNESWVDARRGGTATMTEWSIFADRNPGARLVCIDLQPYDTTQAAEREDILNVGGFTDTVFELIAEFAAGRMNAGHWIARIESVEL